MTGLIHGGPLVVLREDCGGPPKARVDRIVQYLRDRAARRGRAFLRETAARERAEAKPVPCVYCGKQTMVWERSAGIGICSHHYQRMTGRYPFSRDAWRADIPKPLEEALFAARKTLFVFEKQVQQEELYARQVR